MNNKTNLETKPNESRKLFFGLFIFPLVIAFGMAILLAGVVFLTNEKETPETLVLAIKTGSPSKRWQKAFELSNELNQKKNILRSDSLVGELLHIFEDRSHYDAKTRSFIAVALSHFNQPRIIQSLEKALSDEDLDIKIYSVWSLGVLNAKEAASKIKPFLKNESSELRKIAAYVLGSIGDSAVISDLEILLEDPVTDVRWNAALSLAKLGNFSGEDVLIKMLDRQALESGPPLSENEIEKIMVNATKGLALINQPNSIKILQSTSQHERNLKVRQAALDALQYQKEKFLK